MGKRILVVAAGLALALGLLIWYIFFRGVHPRGASVSLGKLQGADIRSAAVQLSPPDVTLPLEEEELEELAGLLRALVVRQRDESWREYAGQGVTYTLELRDGSALTVTAFSPFLIVDGVGYRAAHDPCEALHRFGTRILAERS